jgi:chromosome segregation ATPase
MIDALFYIIILGFTFYVYTQNIKHKRNSDYYEKEFNAIDEKYKHLEQLHIQTDTENHKLHLQFEKFNKYKSEYERLKNIVIKLKTNYSMNPDAVDIQSLKDELDLLKEEEALLIEEEEILKRDNDLLQKRNSLLKAENQNSNEQIDELREATKNIHKYIETINELNKKVQELTQKNEELSAKLGSN